MRYKVVMKDNKLCFALFLSRDYECKTPVYLIQFVLSKSSDFVFLERWILENEEKLRD